MGAYGWLWFKKEAKKRSKKKETKKKKEKKEKKEREEKRRKERRIIQVPTTAVLPQREWVPARDHWGEWESF
jgi:hypothetical protein